MEPAMQRRFQRSGWNKAAACYEERWREQLQPAHNGLFDLAGIRRGETIIDVACGTGLVSFRALYAIGEKGFLVGIDISEHMVAIAHQIAAGNKMTNVRFERMDAEELTLDDKAFDVALCSLGLMYIPGPVRALQEMYRVLKEGGRCCSVVWGRRNACGWANIISIIGKRVSSEVFPNFFDTGDEDTLEKMLITAGFSDISTRRISSFMTYQSSQDACAASLEGGPAALVYFKLSDDQKKAVQDEYLSSIAAYKVGNGYAIPGEFLVALGSK